MIFPLVYFLFGVINIGVLIKVVDGIRLNKDKKNIGTEYKRFSKGLLLFMIIQGFYLFVGIFLIYAANRNLSYALLVTILIIYFFISIYISYRVFMITKKDNVNSNLLGRGGD